MQIFTKRNIFPVEIYNLSREIRINLRTILLFRYKKESIMFGRFSLPTKFAEATLTYDAEVSAQLANCTDVVRGLIERYQVVCTRALS